MSDADRLEALEFKIVHLERGLQELSDVLVRQQQDIERLRAQVRRLADELLDSRQQAPAPTDADEVPPHY